MGLVRRDASFRVRGRAAIRPSLVVALLFATLSATDGRGDEPQWGNLKLRMVCPDAKEATLPSDESLTIDDKTNAIADVVVFVRGKTQTVHPRYAASDDDVVEIRLTSKAIEPRITVLRKSQTLKIRAVGDVPMNVAFAPGRGNIPYNYLLSPQNPSFECRFKNAIGAPALLESSTHRDWKGYVLVLEHPYHAVSGTDGVIRIRDIPVGEIEFCLWHERSRTSGWLGGEHGVHRLAIKPGDNDYGDAEIFAEVFSRPR
jgi:hypothetical protein